MKPEETAGLEEDVGLEEDAGPLPESLPEWDWRDRRVLLGLSGGIAAYKVCAVASALAKAGVQVRAMLTDQAQRFIPPLTLSTLCRHPAYTDAEFWHASQPRPLHIDLGEWAEVLLIAPLSANTLAKLAYGLADNLLTNTVLASTCPILVAPAMNTDMWQQASVQRNWHLLLSDRRYHSVGPESGVLACDRQGTGRMAEPELMLAQLQSLLYSRGQRDLAGRRLLISAGSTREFLDPVRFLGNPATGRMGIALAQAAVHRGAAVTLVHGPADERDLAQLDGVACLPVTSAEEMRQAMLVQCPQSDWMFMAAAVADVGPAHRSAYKLPKAELPKMLPLAPAADIAAELGKLKRLNQRLIGFAAQTGDQISDLVTPAIAKLQRKGLDAIFANPVDQPNSGFGSPVNHGVWISRDGKQAAIAACPKLVLAHRLLDLTSQLPS